MLQQTYLRASKILDLKEDTQGHRIKEYIDMLEYDAY
jgi:hypothetical protein